MAFGRTENFSPVWLQWYGTALEVCGQQSGILEVACQFLGVPFLTVTIMQALFLSHQRSVVAYSWHG